MFIYHIISATPTCSFGTLQTYTFETFPKWWNPTRSFSLHPLSGNKSNQRKSPPPHGLLLGRPPKASLKVHTKPWFLGIHTMHTYIHTYIALISQASTQKSQRQGAWDFWPNGVKTINDFLCQKLSWKKCGFCMFSPQVSLLYWLYRF